jgi:hypothetical protein
MAKLDPEREARLAAALRDNLRKRKAGKAPLAPKGTAENQSGTDN